MDQAGRDHGPDRLAIPARNFTTTFGIDTLSDARSMTPRRFLRMRFRKFAPR
jgi:hypothetical protein